MSYMTSRTRREGFEYHWTIALFRSVAISTCAALISIGLLTYRPSTTGRLLLCGNINCYCQELSHSSATEEEFGSERTLIFPETISQYDTFSELYAEWAFLASSP
jgi:hypothetical protein